MNVITVRPNLPVFRRALDVGHEPVAGTVVDNLLSPEAIRRMGVMWRAEISTLGIATAFGIEPADVERIAAVAGWAARPPFREP